jgi:hypothetical protein
MTINDRNYDGNRRMADMSFVKACTVFLLLIMFPGGRVFCQVDPSAFADKLLSGYKKAGNDSLKIEILSDLAFYYFDFLGDNKTADSLSDAAIRIAEKSHRPELVVLSMNRYAESNDLHEYYQKALGYALKAEQVLPVNADPEISFRINKNLVSVYLSGYEYDKALEYSYKLLSIAGTDENIGLKAESYLFIGQSLEGKNQRIEAFRNYLNAAGLADRIKNKKLQGECYSRLSNFYNLNKLYNKATHYKLLQRDMITNTNPVDSVALMWTAYDLQVIDLNSNNNQLEESQMQDILDYAARNRNKRLLNYEIALIRTHYIEADKIGLLHDLYYRKFPHELQRLAVENPALFFRLKAFFCEEEHRPDSALYYFSKAEVMVRSDPNKILQSKFYNRFGQFLMRHGQEKKAIEKFLQSFDMARAASYIDYMLVAAKQLETIYAREGDYKNALNYAVMNKVLNDSMDNMSKKDQLLIMEIDHETRQRDLVAEQEKQSTTRRHYLQYSAMTIGILTVFVILIMLGSLKVPEWIIRTLGFFSFIFLFEFIILLADQQIHEITHGEPWKVLLIKIFLIAILLPLHHSIEKRVITYLLNHKLLDISRFSPVKRFKKQVGRWASWQVDKRTEGQEDGSNT